MSPTLFAGLVATAIIVATVALGAVVLLALRTHAESQMRRRLAPEIGGAMEIDGPGRAPLLSTMARGGRAIESVIDTEGESARLLLQAGWRGTEQRLLWYAFQAALPFVLGGLVLLFWATGEVRNKVLVVLLLAVAAAILSFLLPRWILRSVAASRRRRIKSEVPLFIHLLMLLFEAGLSTRQALASLIREGGGVLPEIGRELELITRQLEAGADTGEVMKNLSETLEVDDLATVFAVLRQVDRYGGEIREPLLDALDVIEERRGLDLREKVNLLSGRMTVVMVGFFFPALLAFVAGPAFIAIIRALGQVSGRE